MCAYDKRIRLAEIAELDETHWYAHEGDSPTCRSLLQHMQLIDEVDMGYPIILAQDGRVMDGMHRVCRAVREGEDTICAPVEVAPSMPPFAEDGVECVVTSSFWETP